MSFAIRPAHSVLLRVALLFLIGVSIPLFHHVAFGEIVIATETARGTWENGTFSRGKPEFRFRFEIDEAQESVILTEIVRLKDETVIDQPVKYRIMSRQDETDLATFLLTSEKRKSERVLTLVGMPGTLATEVILLGETFFEYCKASSGRLYLSTGSVKYAVSVGDDTVQHQKGMRDALKKPKKIP